MLGLRAGGLGSWCKNHYFLAIQTTARNPVANNRGILLQWRPSFDWKQRHTSPKKLAQWLADLDFGVGRGIL
jgi:hypothetical protein